MSVSDTDAKPPRVNRPEHLALELTCPICLQLFSEPVSLPCGHVYCRPCLQTMGAGLDQHSCPECQAEYQGPEALVKNLKMCSIVETYKATAAGKGNTTANLSKVCCVTFKSHVSFVPEMSETKAQQEVAIANQSQEESSGCPLKELIKESEHGVQEPTGKDGFHSGSASTEHPFSLDKEPENTKGKMDMDEPKCRLASQVTELALKLELAEGVLRKEKEREVEVITANTQLRERAAELLKRMMGLWLRYSAEVTELVEDELCPGETSVRGRVSRASELTAQLRRTVLRAEAVLTGEDEAVFSKELHILQPHIVELMAKPLEEEEGRVESKVNPARACPKLEQMNTELRKGLGVLQRSLRIGLNPSEVSFDPETAHPNLVLSEDLKTATYCTTKQPYPSSPQRFSSFLQVLSSQSFYGGDHCWVVELEGSPWIIGMCYSRMLTRSGLPSALESSRSSWCLMWHENQLRAFEQGRDIPLKKTTVSCKLEIRLSFNSHSLSFYNISPSSGKTHVYTFKAHLTEPVHLAYRMMSGQPRARVTICSE